MMRGRYYASKIDSIGPPKGRGHMSKQAIVALAACAAFVAGCGKSEVTYNAGDAKVTVDQKSGTAVIEETAQGATTRTTINTGNALPPDFPKDVPVFRGAVAQMTSVEEGQTQIIFRAAAPVSEVAGFYEKALTAQGWAIDATVRIENTVSLEAHKEQRKCSIGISGDGNGTLLTLQLEKEGA